MKRRGLQLPSTNTVAYTNEIEVGDGWLHINCKLTFDVEYRQRPTWTDPGCDDHASLTEVKVESIQGWPAGTDDPDKATELTREDCPQLFEHLENEYYEEWVGEAWADELCWQDLAERFEEAD